MLNEIIKIINNMADNEELDYTVADDYVNYLLELNTYASRYEERSDGYDDLIMYMDKWIKLLNIDGIDSKHQVLNEMKKVKKEYERIKN